MAQASKVLIVDDKPQNLYALEKLLRKLDVDVWQAASGNEALGLTLEHDFAVAIVDVQMPEMDGYELVELLRANPATAALPVIFVSAIFSDEFHSRRGYEAGAVDFLSKPFIPEILLAKVRVFLDLYHQRRELQSLVTQLNRANATLSQRALHLQIGSQVGQHITSILEPERLLHEVVQLLQESFDYYVADIWLLNANRDALVLHATSHRDTQEFLGQEISLSQECILVHVHRTGIPYQAPDVLVDPIYMPVPVLPLTRSELTLPLNAQHELLGVLDVQSDRPAAFAPEDLLVLQLVCDQIAVALRNARLYAQIVRFNEDLEAQVQARTAELREAYYTLEAMDRTKTDFINVAAHELRTPLALIRGYTGMLRGMLAEQPEVVELLSGIQLGEGRMLELVNSLLDVSRIDRQAMQPHKESTRLAEVFQTIVAGLEPALSERRLTLTLEHLDELPPVLVDPELIQKVFTHLVLNAIKYTPDDRWIAVRGRVLHAEAGTAGRDDLVEIAVQDSGIGINPAHHRLIFEKFYQTGSVQLHSSGRTKFKGGGPGLGLAIARGIVELHGGRIWVESPGHDEQALPGSVFYVVLPVMPPD